MTQLVVPTLITFDAGQVLVELDLDFLARRLGERGLAIAVGALEGALPAAWRHHDELVKAGARHPWHELIGALLRGAGVAEPAPHVDWLYAEQRRANLWRKPIGAVVALARELAASGHHLAVLSNSEGHLAELLAEVGIADPFRAIVDSGRLGFAKPDKQIFEHVIAALVAGTDGAIDSQSGPPSAGPPSSAGPPPSSGPVGLRASPRPIHIGDSWAADVVGARQAGWRAIWYGAHVHPVDDPDIAAARDPDELRAALERLLARDRDAVASPRVHGSE